jgi:hypothetical protein
MSLLHGKVDGQRQQPQEASEDLPRQQALDDLALKESSEHLSPIRSGRGVDEAQRLGGLEVRRTI